MYEHYLQYPLGGLSIKGEFFPHTMLGHPSLTTSHTLPVSQRPLIVDLNGSVPHALFMDCTHDNETPHQKRTAIDTLPNAAIVAMTNCAIGSVRGYDEIVPELLQIVTEKRKYKYLEGNEGIIPGKVRSNLYFILYSPFFFSFFLSI